MQNYVWTFGKDETRFVTKCCRKRFGQIEQPGSSWANMSAAVHVIRLRFSATERIRRRRTARPCGKLDASSGTYYAPAKMFHLKGDPVPVKVPKPALDEETAGRLWKTAEQLTGITWVG